MSKERRRINVRDFQIFEAVARHRSLTRAAEELGITQSAVSHQLRTLTERLGEDLVERQGRAIRLTDAGKRVARSLDAAFDLIEEQVTVFESDRKIVRVGAYSSFAASWLIPRLPDFRVACPDVELRLIMLYDPHETSALLADIFITSAAGDRVFSPTFVLRAACPSGARGWTRGFFQATPPDQC